LVTDKSSETKLESFQKISGRIAIGFSSNVSEVKFVKRLIFYGKVGIRL